MMTFESRCDLELTYLQFLHQFSFSYDYFRFLKLCGIKVNVNIEKNMFEIYYICYFNFTLNYTPIGDNCFYLHYTMKTVANKDEILITL